VSTCSRQSPPFYPVARLLSASGVRSADHRAEFLSKTKAVPFSSLTCIPDLSIHSQLHTCPVSCPELVSFSMLQQQRRCVSFWGAVVPARHLRPPRGRFSAPPEPYRKTARIVRLTVSAARMHADQQHCAGTNRQSDDRVVNTPTSLLTVSRDRTPDDRLVPRAAARDHTSVHATSLAVVRRQLFSSR